MRYDDVVACCRCPRIEPPDGEQAKVQAEQLGGHKTRHGPGRDTGEGVGDRAGQRQGRIREGGRAGEEVAGTDIRGDRGGAADVRPERASANTRSTRPAVATASDRGRAPLERRVCDQESSGCPYIAEARMVPATAPATCAPTYAPACRPLSPLLLRRPSSQSASDTTGHR